MKIICLLNKYKYTAFRFVLTGSVVLFDVAIAQPVYLDDSDLEIMKLVNILKRKSV